MEYHQMDKRVSERNYKQKTGRMTGKLAFRQMSLPAALQHVLVFQFSLVFFRLTLHVR
jgi:hypothetical protein